MIFTTTTTTTTKKYKIIMNYDRILQNENIFKLNNKK